MKRFFPHLFFVVLLAGSTTLRGEDLRVEWLSGKTIRALKFEAGTTPLQLCSKTQKDRCLLLKPGHWATCVSSVHTLRCQTAGENQSFEGMTATSPTPFHFEGLILNSQRGEEWRSGRSLGAEIVSFPKGPRVVLTVDLESYVRGVLLGEAGVLKSRSALEAMAIVARTWGMRSRGRHQKEGFDFCSLTHCQVFNPPPDIQGGLPTTMELAARNTQGKVLKYQGQLTDVYFSADCGGMTEAAGGIWPDRAAPYLVSVRDPYCGGSQHSAWRQTLPMKTVSAIVRYDLNIAMQRPLMDLKIDARDSSGRARTLRMVGGSAQALDANEFRYAVNRRLGWNTLKSSLYTVERRNDALLFSGRGLGHGVGLCQSGAERMGQLKIGSEKILATYFPGTAVSDLSAANSADPILSSEHFELVFPDNQQPWVTETLQALEAARSEIGKRIGELPPRIRVETFATTLDFIHASRQPGWTAAATDGLCIQLQPLGALNRKGILNSTLRHELTHLAVHRLRSPKVPRWFEEGLVLYTTGEKVRSDPHFKSQGRSLEDGVSSPRSETEMKAAYAVALERVRTKARERGEASLWQILKNPSTEDLHWLRER